MKTVISVILIILLMVINAVLSYFEFSYTILLDPNYWIEQVVTQIPIIIIIFVMRSLYKQRELSQNKDILFVKDIIDKAYDTIHTSVTYLHSFKSYIASDNRKRKLDAYKGVLERHLLSCEKKIIRMDSLIQGRKHRLELKAQKKSLLEGREVKPEEHNPLMKLRTRYLTWRLSVVKAKKALYEARKSNAEEIIDFIHVRYYEVSYATLFTDRDKVKSDNRNLAIHEKRDVSTLLGTKILGIIAVGILFSSTFIFNMTGDVFDIVYSVIFKLLQTALAIYTGATSGTMFVRTEVALRLKLRVAYLQEFFAREREISHE